MTHRSREDLRWERLFNQLEVIIKQNEVIMHTLADVLQDVKDEGTLIDGIGTLVNGLRKQVADALANTGQVSPEVQDQIEQIFAQAEANKTKIASNLLSGTADAPQSPAPSAGSGG
jgi:uncharacterized protein YoxC